MIFFGYLSTYLLIPYSISTMWVSNLSLYTHKDRIVSVTNLRPNKSQDDLPRRNIIFECNFERENSLQSWFKKEVPSEVSMRTTKSVARRGRYSLKVRLNSQDQTIANGKRAEVLLRPESRFPLSRWYGFSILFPEDYYPDSSPESLVQWHTVPNLKSGETWRTPPISIQSHHGSLYLVAIQASDSDFLAKQLMRIPIAKIKHDVWNDFVIFIKFSDKADGKIKLWHNERLVITKDGPNVHLIDRPIFFKLGIYKWDWMTDFTVTEQHRNRKTESRTIFYDELRVGDEKATYFDVNP